MTLLACAGATLKCSFGMATSTFVPTPKKTTSNEAFAANALDHQAIANIPPFGVCISLANPSVAAATSAALGVLTPMPCIPVTPAPWVTTAKTLLESAPTLNQTSTLQCVWGGVIHVMEPGQKMQSVG